MNRTSAGVNARGVFTGLPFGVVVLFLAKVDESDASIRMLGEISARTRLEDTRKGDWDNSLEKGTSSLDSAALDTVAMLPERVSEIAKQRYCRKKKNGEICFEIGSTPQNG